VGTGQLVGLLLTRGIYHSMSGRLPQSIAYLRESVRLATQSDNNLNLGRALLNLSDALTHTDPAAAAEAARTGAGHLRRAGSRDFLAFATTNLVQALLMLGDWDAAAQELTQAADADGLADYDYITCYTGWLAALRGDTATAQTLLAALADLRASEDPQDQALISIVEAFTAAARHQPEDALRRARATLAHAGALGIGHEFMRWVWPLAARAAHDLGDTAATGELLTLLDQADHLTRLDDTDAAAAAVGEARDIARRLRCQPLLDRAAAFTSARTRAR
jgi:tetratricopeptide (TPR) repeat protein